MRIIIVVAFALVTLVTRGQYSFTSGFSPGQRPLLDESVEVNGTWHEDVLQHASGYQVVGSLGLADGTGSARSETFGPIDITRGKGEFGDFPTEVANPEFDPNLPPGPLNQPTIPGPTDSYHAYVELTVANGVPLTDALILTLYDPEGGSSFWEIPVLSLAGVWSTAAGDESEFNGNLDWTRVNRFSIDGAGGTESMEFGADSLLVTTAVPEPGAVGSVVALGLVGLVVWRRAKGLICRPRSGV